MKKPSFEECIECQPPKRYPGCQDHCEYGIKTKKALEEFNESNWLRRHAHSECVDIEFERIIRVRKRKGR